jgi:hypothetical protein
VLAFPVALFFIFDPEARSKLATPGPWIALAVALVVAGPHIAWLITHDLLPFQYVDERAAPSRSLVDRLVRPLQTVVVQLVALLPTLLIASPLAWPLPTSPQGRADHFSYRAVTLLAFGPIATFALIAMVTGRGTQTS